MLPSEVEGLNIANPIGYLSGVDTQRTPTVAMTTSDGIGILWSSGFAIRAANVDNGTQASFATDLVLDSIHHHKRANFIYTVDAY